MNYHFTLLAQYIVVYILVESLLVEYYYLFYLSPTPRGVLQGDSLSSLLFTLVICDIIQFMKDCKLWGIQVLRTRDILMLLYADDLVLLTHRKSDLQRKIDVLWEHRTINRLEVITEKTKVVVFRRGGWLWKIDSFFYDGKPMEILKKYTNLSVIFSSSGVFRKHLDYALSKTRVAQASKKTIMDNSKIDLGNQDGVIRNHC